MRNRDYTSEIAELTEKLRKIEAEKLAFESQTPTQQLADLLHNSLCRHNHTDACDYFYNEWGHASSGYSRTEYYIKASSILILLGDDIELAKKVVASLDKR